MNRKVERQFEVSRQRVFWHQPPPWRVPARLCTSDTMTRHEYEEYEYEEYDEYGI